MIQSSVSVLGDFSWLCPSLGSAPCSAGCQPAAEVLMPHLLTVTSEKGKALLLSSTESGPTSLSVHSKPVRPSHWAKLGHVPLLQPIAVTREDHMQTGLGLNSRTNHWPELAEYHDGLSRRFSDFDSRNLQDTFKT